MRVGVSTGVPQNYCLQFWDAALNNVGSQCLMYLINALHWRTDIRIDQVKSHIFTNSVAADRAIEFVRYHNVDLMDIASKKSTDIQSYNYEQLSGLKYEISDKLSSFTTDIQSEVYLCAGLLL